jgi:rod shape-determining protein MreB
LRDRVDIPVKIGEDPLTAVARGTGQILDNLEHLKTVLESAESLS